MCRYSALHRPWFRSTKPKKHIYSKHFKRKQYINKKLKQKNAKVFLSKDDKVINGETQGRVDEELNLLKNSKVAYKRTSL
jgi:hypothetical protein